MGADPDPEPGKHYTSYYDGYITYCALRGEPLTEIAAKFDVPPADLVKMNSWDGHSGLHNLTKRSNLIVSTKLTIAKLDGTDGGGVSTRPKAAAQARFAASNPHSVSEP